MPRSGDTGGTISPEQFGALTAKPAREPAAQGPRVFVLYLRSRLAGRALLALAIVASLAWAGAWWLPRFTLRSPGDGSLTPLLVLGTLAAACVVGTGAGSPFGDAERTSARPLRSLRLAHLGSLLVYGALLLVTALLSLDLTGAQPPAPTAALLRNLAGFAGLALLAALVVGAGTSWILPFVFVVFARLAARQPDGSFAAWAWHMQSGRDTLSWTIALCLLAAGLCAVCLRGAREPTGETG